MHVGRYICMCVYIYIYIYIYIFRLVFTLKESIVYRLPPYKLML